ncbi:CBS domain-containing protein [Paenibacillus tengchongensis]|uniref:CBS domain-containing protein n=1 Tax=Paenibacillus tengchongensis TaxID=2608684 RepID=UPI00124DF78A|nr:CBS domain-containing protein [Paenibacillus tengchongensis]
MSTVAVSPLSAFLRSAPAVKTSQTCRETLRVMFQHPESKCIVVCSSGNEPVGLLMSERFFLKVTGRTGSDMIYREPASKLMNRQALTLDLSTPAETALAAAMNRHEAMRNDSIIITDQGKYAGVVYPADLMGSVE